MRAALFQDASRIALDASSEIDREKLAYVMGISATLTKRASDALEVASLVGVVSNGVSQMRPS